MFCVCLQKVLFIVVKRQSVYCVNKFEMPLLGLCVSAGTLMRNYGATNVAPTQEDRPLLSSKRRPRYRTRKRSWNEYELGDGSRWDRKPGTILLVMVSSNLLDRTDWATITSIQIVSS
jgi:hypothetical protein